MNIDGTEPVTLFPDADTQKRIFALEIDSPNGHIYWTGGPRFGGNSQMIRGNLDGSVKTTLFTAPAQINGFALDLLNQKIYYSVDEVGIYVFDLVEETSTPLYLAGHRSEVTRPEVFFDPVTSTVYWIGPSGSIRTLAPGATSPEFSRVPIIDILGAYDGGSSRMVFGSGAPVLYSFAGLPAFGTPVDNNILVIGALDEEGPFSANLEGPTGYQGAKIDLDLEGGFIFFSGSVRTADRNIAGVFRTKLDGSEFTTIIEGFGGPIALDTADLGDSTDPVVTIFSPVGGTTDNQTASLVGSASDDSALNSVTWSHDGVPQGPAQITDGDFSVPSITLHPGENLLEVFATDVAGNTGSAQVSVTWQPLRSLTISNPGSVREGHRIEIQTLFDGPGDVAGMTFTLHYDPEFFESPTVETGEVLAGFAPLVGTQTAGEVSVTFASPTETLPTGQQLLISSSLRARSVPGSASTDLHVTISDMADTLGNPIVVGNFAGSSEIMVEARSFTGDINSNGRLDIGDASRMQAMLTGQAEKRVWDDTINDLNLNLTLDSGDVIRVLRAVVGINPQPTLPPAPRAKSGNQQSIDADAPRIRLSLSSDHGMPGEEIAVRVELENPGAPLSGASFALDYPAEFLRLESPAAHNPGMLVGGDAILLWNLAPALNDYSQQDGSIRFGVSSPSSWPGSQAGGTLAEFRFTVTAAVGSQGLVPITVHEAEISTDSGFEISAAIGDSAAFVTAAQSFDSWRTIHFSAGDLMLPAISGWDGDADGDGCSNAWEYFAGTGPNDGASKPQIDAAWSQDGDGAGCLAITFQRALSAIDASASLQVSSDLSTWQTLSDLPVDRETDLIGGIETTTVQVASPESRGRQYARLVIELVE